MKIASNRRGGRRKSEKPRVDYGTPEAIRRRVEAIGARRVGWPQPDLTNASTALGVLLWQGYLHERYDQAKRMHDAGVMFCGWWLLVYPKTFEHGTLAQLQPGMAGNVDTAEAEAHLTSTRAVLGKERAVLDEVINTCVYSRMNYRRLDKLRTGLCRLVEWQNAQRRAA